ncbi:MAG: Fic family protein [Actinomycetota bacterium]|nr:Fic family protein [Actinomycetota bacterium]
MFSYTLTPEISRDLARFDVLSKRFDVIGVLPRTWSGRIRRDLEAEAIGASVILEGVSVTVDEVRRIFADDRPFGVSEEDVALVRGYREAMWFVLTRSDDPYFEWTSETLRTIHTSVMGRSWTARAGRYRERQNWLQDSSTGEQTYLPPATEDVARFVDELVQWLSGPAGEVEVLVRAALAHVMLAAIHPFADGNGRTARILASLVMYRGGCRMPAFTSLEEWWGSHPADYYAAFECLGDMWNPTADVTQFVAAHVAAQRTQAEALALRFATERVLWAVLEDIVVHDLDMDSRVANALWEGFFGREVTNRYYRGIADIPQVTASHDLKQLATSGLMDAVGEGRSRAYFGTMDLARRVTSALDLQVDVAGIGAIEAEVRGDIMAAVAAMEAR